MRKLATIRKVADIKPIKDADAIELAIIDGWQCVVKKGSVKKEDIVLYAEIDSFLPVKPEFEFLRKSSFKTMADGSAGFRLKTVRLRGELSQGLVMPLKDVGLDCAGIGLGQDVTEALGVKLYEPPIPADISGMVEGAMPSFIKKTDEERCLSEECLVMTEWGEKTIKEICENKIRGRVASYNINLDILEYKNIISHSIMDPDKNVWLKIKTKRGKTIILTKEHKIWVSNLNFFKTAKELKIGDKVKIINYVNL
jgi:hypothetical protein